MASSRGAGQASFDTTFEMDTDDEFSGFYAKNVELAVTVTWECLPIPTAGEVSRRSHHEVDISDFENLDIASSDDETLIIDPKILDVGADLQPKWQKPVD